MYGDFIKRENYTNSFKKQIGKTLNNTGNLINLNIKNDKNDLLKFEEKSRPGTGIVIPRLKNEKQKKGKKKI